MPLSAVTAKSDANHVLMRIDCYTRTPPVIRRSNHAMDIAMDVGYRVAINISVGNSPAMPKPNEGGGPVDDRPFLKLPKRNCVYCVYVNCLIEYETRIDSPRCELKFDIILSLRYETGRYNRTTMKNMEHRH